MLFKTFNSFKWKNILHSKHFRSSFSVMLSAATLLFLAAGTVMTVQRTQELRKNLEEHANYTAAAVSEALADMKRSAVFIGNLPSVSHVLSNPAPTIDQLSRLIDDVAPYLSTSSYENICFYFNKNGRIFDTAGGMYHYDDFYDPELLSLLQNMPQKELWLIDVPYERYYAPRPAVNVLTYARRLPLYHSATLGYVTVSCPMTHISRVAADATSRGAYPAVVTFQEQLLYASSEMISQQWDAAKTSDENCAAIFSSSLPYSSYSVGQVQCTFFLSRSQLAATLFRRLPVYLLTYAAGILLLFGVSLVYAGLMLRPVDEIMKKLGVLPYTNSPGGDIDEFSRLNAALDGLNARVSSIQSIMQENRQLVKERLLSGLLYNYVNLKSLPEEYRENGLVFPHTNYAVLLIQLFTPDDVHDYTRQEQLKLLVSNSAAEAFSVLGCTYSLYTDQCSICILLNTPLYDTLPEELSRICTALKQRIRQTMDIYPLFSAAVCSRTAPSLWKAWQLARRNCIFTAADHDDFFMIGFQDEFTSSIDPELLLRLSRALIDRDHVAALKAADLLWERHMEAAPFPECQRMTAIALCSLYASRLDNSGEMPEIQINTFFKKLENASDSDECRKYFYSCIRNMLDAKNKISEETQEYIRQASSYVEEHFAEPLTIPQIADAVGISSVYLSRLFKLSTGKTLSEYLNFYRNQRSIALLLDTTDTINDISRQVGYTDVRSYIRFFKKFYYMTPSEYRRTHSAETT